MQMLQKWFTILALENTSMLFRKGLIIIIIVILSEEKAWLLISWFDNSESIS